MLIIIIISRLIIVSLNHPPLASRPRSQISQEWHQAEPGGAADEDPHVGSGNQPVVL